MIILNKDKLQKNEYIFLDDLEQITSINKKKLILTKDLWMQKGQLLKTVSPQYLSSTIFLIDRLAEGRLWPSDDDDDEDG